MNVVPRAASGPKPSSRSGPPQVNADTGRGATTVRRFHFRGERSLVRDRSAKAALQVLRFALIGVPDDQRGETVKLFVVLKPEYQGKVSESELIDWAREHMEAYKYPRQVAFIDTLPATPAGKVLRRLLKDD